MKPWNRIIQKTFFNRKLSSNSKQSSSPEALSKPESDSFVNNYYNNSIPSPQNAVDIFKGAWSSKFPGFMSDIEAGNIGLFEDERLFWLFSEAGSLEGKSVLELGPLEGGHSYMLEKNGAESIIAIEANTRAYLKCLITKELLGLERVHLLCGDFVEYLKDSKCPNFEVVVASGVLYHMLNPVELISLLANRCSQYLFLWTHYYEEAWAKSNTPASRFVAVNEQDYSGFSCQLFRQYYGESTSLGWFCGGTRPYSNWMLRDDILNCLKYFGFSEIKINFDQPDHPNGPAFALIAKRS